MKRVSFEVAKYLKEVGYPQDYLKDNICVSEPNAPFSEVAYQPTYLEVWFWLLRRKGIQIYPKKWSQPSCVGSIIENNNGLYHEIYILDNNDTEEAIIAAIEYLVENGLIK